MRIIFQLLFLAASLAALGQKSRAPQSFAKTITPNDLKKHLYIIAGAEMEGRETGTAGQRKAAAYIENQFKDLGLQPANKGSFQMFYNLYQDSITDATIEVNGQAFSMDKDFTPIVTNIPATLLFSEVVLVSSNSSDLLKNSNLAGRLVMILGSITQGGIGELLQSKGGA